MIKVVLDTNVIISSVFWTGAPYAVVEKGLLGKYELITSPDILDEIVNKLRNKFKFPEENIQQLIDLLLRFSHVIEPISKIDIVRDKTDNKIIECAIDSNANYIITGDLDLLELKEFEKIKIVNARTFLDLIN